MPGPLASIRVRDATRVVLGPLAAQTLGDYGADVIKIEPPEGDTTRQLGPARHPAMAAFYLGCNRNKRRLVLDLKQPAESLLEDPQLTATGFWKVMEHPTEGALRTTDILTTFSETPGAITRYLPRLGEHSVEVLLEAGFRRAEIDSMLASGDTAEAR